MSEYPYESETIRLKLEPEQQAQRLCLLIEDLLPLYLEGEVSPGSRDLIVRHLAECERCAGFLAGAQSVRAQLRAERQQRASVLQRDLPAQQTLASGQRQATGFSLIGGYVLIVIGGAMLIDFVFIHHRYVPPLMVLLGLILGFGGLTLILLAARSKGLLAERYAPLTALRIIALLGAMGIGSLGATIIVEPGDGPNGLLMLLVGLAGVWLALASPATRATAAADLPPRPQPRPELRHVPPQRVAGLLLLALGPLTFLAVVLAGPSGMVRMASALAPTAALLLILIGLLLQARRQK